MGHPPPQKGSCKIASENRPRSEKFPFPVGVNFRMPHAGGITVPVPPWVGSVSSDFHRTKTGFPCRYKEKLVRAAGFEPATPSV